MAGAFDFLGMDNKGTAGQGGNQYFNVMPSLPTAPVSAKSPFGAGVQTSNSYTTTPSSGTMFDGAGGGLYPNGGAPSNVNTGSAPSSTSNTQDQSEKDPNRWLSVIPGVGDFIANMFGGGENPQGDMANNFFKWLNGQVGKGATPFPGELNAKRNPMLEALQKSFMDPKGIMAQMLQTGMPVDQTPQWEAMKDSMKRTQDQGRTNLKESFSFGGGLAGSPFGTAATDYESQTGKDMNAQLMAAVTQALEQARGRQMQGAGMEASFGKEMQDLDQSDIMRKYEEFIRTQPEYSPLLNMMYGGSTNAVQTAGKGQSMMNAGMDAAKMAMMFL